MPLLNLYINTTVMQKAVTIQSHLVKKNMPNTKTYTRNKMHTKSKGPIKGKHTQTHQLKSPLLISSKKKCRNYQPIKQKFGTILKKCHNSNKRPKTTNINGDLLH